MRAMEKRSKKELDDGDQILTVVSEAVTSALGRQIPNDASLMDEGMDSLAAVELGSALQIATGTSMPATLAFDYPTIDAIKNFILASSVAVKYDSDGDCSESIGVSPRCGKISKTVKISEELDESLSAVAVDFLLLSTLREMIFSTRRRCLQSDSPVIEKCYRRGTFKSFISDIFYSNKQVLERTFSKSQYGLPDKNKSEAKFSGYRSEQTHAVSEMNRLFDNNMTRSSGAQGNLIFENIVYTGPLAKFQNKETSVPLTAERFDLHRVDCSSNPRFTVHVGYVFPDLKSN
jgi:acyl carrier protein